MSRNILSSKLPTKGFRILLDFFLGFDRLERSKGVLNESPKESALSFFYLEISESLPDLSVKAFDD